jgi:hypothetical protein
MLEYFERAAPGGRAELLHEIRDDATREFLSQTFLLGSWYDVLPTQPACQAASRVCKQPMMDLTRKMAAEAAQRDINGIHRLLLKIASPEMVVERIPSAAKQYYNFVDSTVEKLGRNHYIATGEGIPAGIVTLYMAVTEAFILRALELAGARNARHIWHPLKPIGNRHGVAVVQLRREIEWK